jgi:hypothetical protein
MQPIIEQFMSEKYPGVLPLWLEPKDFGEIVNGEANTHEALTHLSKALIHVARANVLDEEELSAQMGRVHTMCEAIIDLLDRVLVVNPQGYRDVVRQKQLRAHYASTKVIFGQR